MTHELKKTCSIALAIGCVLLATPALADARGAVLKIEGDIAYTDMGTDAGVGVGSTLTLFHVISVKHPVTNKTVRDSFPLARLRVVNAGRRVSMAMIPAPFLKRAKVGDELELASEPQTVIDPWMSPKQSVASADDSAYRAKLTKRKKAVAIARERNALVRQAEAAWQRTLGLSPVERIVVWREFLAAQPQTPYKETVNRAIGELETLVASAAAIRAQSPDAIRAQARIDTLGRLVGGIKRGDELIFDPPTRIDEATPLDFAFLVARPDALANAWLYHRHAGDKTYQRLALKANGDAYLTATIPSAEVRAPGVEYFVEVLDAADGAEPRRLIGSDANPRRTEVEPRVATGPADRSNRSRITFTLDYVDFDGLGNATDNDQYWFGEIDFRYRFKLRGLHSLRLGFGSMEGKGGPKDVIDDDPENCQLNGVTLCRDVAYNYAYTELEWHFGDYVGFMLRPQWGSAYRDNMVNNNAEREFFDAFGLRARLRFGRDDGSNLVLGASATQELGTLFEAGFTWDVIREVPLVFSVHVTDQPVIEDFGVRLLADIGWRRLGWVYPSLRLAYQARDIDHAGFSAGTAINFDW